MSTITFILVADDQPNFAKSTGMVLGLAGYRTLTANDGVEALALLQSYPVDLILSDVDMPRMDGHQLCERVRKNPQWTDIPFIFMSGHATSDDVHHGKELGADDYLTKPVAPQDLLATLRANLRRPAACATMASARTSLPTP